MTANNTDGSAAQSTQPLEFVISREFAVPRDTLFKVWTECAHLRQWFGPKGFPMLRCTNDLRVGGMLHYLLQAPDGTEFWGRWVYREIVPPERLVVIASFSDAQGGITRHPWAADWPLRTLSSTTFSEQDGRTAMTLRWSAYEATAAEANAFANGHESMRQGWSGTLEQLEDYLASLK